MSRGDSCFIDTRGWEVEEDAEHPSSNSYRVLAQSLERNMKKKSTKQNKKSLTLERRHLPVINRKKRLSSEQNELPPIAKSNGQILILKTIDIDPISELRYGWAQRTRRYFKVNLLPGPKEQQNEHKEDPFLKQNNRKYERIREHRANKNSRRLYMHFKSKQEMEATTQKTIEKYLLQQSKQNQQTKSIFCLPVLK